MQRLRSHRLAVVTIGVVLVGTLTASIWDASSTPEVSAQAEPTDSLPSVPLPPAIDPSQTIPDASLTAATPMPATGSTGSTEIVAAPENGDTVSASLGGSDVSVASVGGSYEVDTPKRRAKRESRR